MQSQWFENKTPTCYDFQRGGIGVSKVRSKVKLVSSEVKLVSSEVKLYEKTFSVRIQEYHRLSYCANKVNRFNL